MNQLKREDLSVVRERALLVGVLLPHARIDFNNPLGELAALTESAGAEVVDSMIQRRMTLHPGLAVGTGKAEEIKERAEASEADVIIFDNELSPRQIRGLEKVIERKIIDRSELILDIFAARARTHEAKLQVELAQLEYTSPRLRGMWTHLERIAGAGGGTGVGAVGGVGTRGPGERQIEIDRRIVRDRINALKREIGKIDERKQREQLARTDEFTVSMVGYTNTGKTTLFNRLTESQRFAADMLFATLDTKTARWPLGDGAIVLLSDTVGFVRDLPHHLVASFRATLEETLHADLLLHVVDAASPHALLEYEAARSVIDEVGCAESPTLVLLNKIDATTDFSNAQVIERRAPGSLRISAKTGQGLDALVEAVRQAMMGSVVATTVRVPNGQGRLIAEIERRAQVLARRYVDNDVEFDLRINKSQLDQLRGRFAELETVAVPLP